MTAATGQIGEMTGRSFTDKRRTGLTGSVNPATVLATVANYASLNTIEAALTAADSNAYSQTNLNRMNVNDKIYALRTVQDSAGI